MADPVKPRRYDATRRRAAAAETRRAILGAARALFAEQGYAGTTMSAVAEHAGVALDTVYATIGRKPQLFRLLIETALSGTDQPVEAEQRDYVRAVRAATTAARKIEIYVAALRLIQERMAPLFATLQAAAGASPELEALWREIAERRAQNMRRFVADLAATGELRADVTIEHAADIVWATNAAEFYVLLVRQRGWTPERFEAWLADAWKRLLLRSDGAA